MTDWLPILLEGLVGGVVGSVASFAVAVFVVTRQSRSDREQRRHELSTTRAIEVARDLGRIRRAVVTSAVDTDDAEGLRRDLRDAAGRLDHVGPSAAYVSMTVWFEIAELAGELRSAWLDGIAPAELDQALEELRSVGRHSIYQLGQLGRDVQAVLRRIQSASSFSNGAVSRMERTPRLLNKDGAVSTAANLSTPFLRLLTLRAQAGCCCSPHGRQTEFALWRENWIRRLWEDRCLRDQR
jgi:hypothetical protein